MTKFRYEALDSTGRARSGEMEADDVTSASARLQSQGLVVLSIEVVQDSLHPSAIQTPTPVETSDPDSQLSYEAKIDEVLQRPDRLIKLLEALRAEPASRGLRKELDYLIGKVRAGLHAPQLLGDQRLCIWLPIIMSSERPAAMEVRYSQWLGQVLNERTRRVGLVTFFSYPLVLIAFVLLVFVPICVFIVPEFQKMYREFGLTLPQPTALLFSLADLINHRPHYLILGLGGLIVVCGACVAWWNSLGLTTRWFGWLVAGNRISLIAMSRLTSILAELLELGAPLSEALLLAGKASRHPYYRAASQTLALHLTQPGFTWQASTVAHNFPLALLHAFTAGENYKPSVPLIRELSHAYSDRVSARLGRRMGAASPLVVLAVGLAVAFVVISLFMPLVQMVTSLT